MELFLCCVGGCKCVLNYRVQGARQCVCPLGSCHAAVLPGQTCVSITLSVPTPSALICQAHRVSAGQQHMLFLVTLQSWQGLCPVGSGLPLRSIDWIAIPVFSAVGEESDTTGCGDLKDLGCQVTQSLWVSFVEDQRAWENAECGISLNCLTITSWSHNKRCFGRHGALILQEL